MYNQNKIMRRLLGRSGNDSSTTDNNLGPTGSSIVPSYRPSASQDADYAAGGPIACIDKSPDGQFAVLGGRHVLKTIQVDGSSVKEGIDVRATITTQPSAKPAVSTTVSDQLSIKDVKWATNSSGEPTIFTACANGRIFQYNLSRLGSQAPGGGGLEFVQIREDSRQINTLDINPHRNTWLLSGSQDGIVRAFDTKSPIASRTTQATHRAFSSFKCNAEGIRDVAWSPKDGPPPSLDIIPVASKRQKPKWSITTPAPVASVAWRPPLWSATAGGKRAAQIAVSYVDGPTKGYGISPVHIWDFGRPTMPFKEIDRFDYSPSALLWHDQDLLWTVGTNGFLQCDVAYAPKVIDRKSPSCLAFAPSGDVLMVLEERGQPRRPHPTISTHDMLPSASFSSSPNAQGLSHSRSDSEEDVVSYVDGPTKGYGISPVHIWDFGRPTMPFKEIDRFDYSPSALLWHDQDLLWTVGTNGFLQCDVAYAPKVIDRKSPSCLAFAPSGDVLMVLEERGQPRRPHPTISTHDMLPSASFSSSPNAQGLSHSRSDSEEDVVGSFLGPSTNGSQRSQNSSLRPAVGALSSTPPSGSLGDEPTIPLEQSIAITKGFKPNQVMAIGQVSPPLKAKHYQFLSHHYLTCLLLDLPYGSGRSSLDIRVCGIMEHYARAAESVGQIRLAQTWRVLTQTFSSLLKQRAQYHLEVRMARLKNAKSPLLKSRPDSKLNLQKLVKPAVQDVGGDETPRKASSVRSVDHRSNLGPSFLIGDAESESNVPTPIARPVREDLLDSLQLVPGKLLTPVQELDSFRLPPGFHKDFVQSSPRKRHDSAPLSETSHNSQISSTEGYDFYDIEALEEIPNAIDVPKKKEPLSLDYVEPRPSSSQRRHATRHDSEESFNQMFSVSDSTNIPTAGSSLSSSVRRVLGQGDETFDSTQSSLEDYHSRIRGKQIRESHDDSGRGEPQILDHADSASSQDIFMISQSTADSGGSQQSQLEFHDFSQPSVELLPVQPKVKPSQSPRNNLSEKPQSEQPEENTSTTITETDFMPWDDDPPYPFPMSAETEKTMTAPSLKPYELLSRVLAYEAQHSALNASAIILLLRPLVPEHVVDSHMASAILRHHHDRLMRQQFFIEAALLRNLCVVDWPDGMEVWGDNYTSIFFPAQDPQRVSVSFSCPNCHKPREVNRSTNSLEKEPLERKVREQTRNTIPLLHRNDQKMEGEGEFIGSAPAVIGGVRGDGVIVSQSRAVEGVREALRSADIGNGNLAEDGSRLSRAAGGILSVLGTSPGRSSAQESPVSGSRNSRVNDRNERDKRKSVKFAGAADERR
ncbi:SEA (Seh1-associated) complex subunit [Pestalotiopsis sp. 9143b]|nr:SEA (Seh1-associated) complex subunit [Pestalotiopsis sp. 9143b]